MPNVLPVVTKSRKMNESDCLKQTDLRRATKKDLEQAAANQKAADEALKIGKEKSEHTSCQ